MQTVQAGRGRTQQHRTLAHLATFERNITRMVAKAILLFIRQVVFFIQDDQAKPRQRGKNGRARTNNNLRRALLRRLPRLQALYIRHARMQHHCLGMKT